MNSGFFPPHDAKSASWGPRLPAARIDGTLDEAAYGTVQPVADFFDQYNSSTSRASTNRAFIVKVTRLFRL